MRFHSSRYNSKYGAKKTVVDGIIFDSAGEARRYQFLKDMVWMGVIENLELQKKHVLIPAQYEEGTITKSGKFKRGKLIERECVYKSDFEYDMNGKHYVEDYKGLETPYYKMKRKLMLWKYNIRIIQVKFYNQPTGGDH